MFGLKSIAQGVRFDLNTDVQQSIDLKKRELDALKLEICQQVDLLSQDVTKSSDGSLLYPNWVRFDKIAQDISSLNEQWNEAYAAALETVIERAISSGATDVTASDEKGQDEIFDILEETHLNYSADMASECYEAKFDFVSLRRCLEQSEDEYLESSQLDFDPKFAPTIMEEIDDEEYWTLITCDKRYSIQNKVIDDSMLQGMSDWEKVSLLTQIKDIVGILKDIVEIVGQIQELMVDCDGSTDAKSKDIRDGFPFEGRDRKMGYLMRQTDVKVDFKHTKTKIKGKAKIWRKKKNDKYKKDRKSKASLGFCAKEWNSCDGRDWPSDPGPFLFPHHSKRMKVVVKYFEPKALSIDKTYHFLQFKFGRNGVFVEALNLLGSQGCVSSSNTNW